jgi:intracellular septation protein
MQTIESDTTPTKEEKQHPGLKMALELGPLLVFFFGNLRGEWLVGKFPALSAIGGPLLVATALFMVATVISLVISKIVFKHLPVMPFVSGVVVMVFGSGCRTRPSSR